MFPTVIHTSHSDSSLSKTRQCTLIARRTMFHHIFSALKVWVIYFTFKP